MKDLPRKDYYGVLRLPVGSSEAVIRRRFRRLAKLYHPDVNPSPDAAAQFSEIRDAYEVLTDPFSRSIVDSWYGVGETARQSSAAEFTSPQQKTPDRAPANMVSLIWPALGEAAWAFCQTFLISFELAFIVQAAMLRHSLSVSLYTALHVGLVLGLLRASIGPLIWPFVWEALAWWFAWWL